MKLEEEVKRFMQDKNKSMITANQYQIEAKSLIVSGERQLTRQDVLRNHNAYRNT